MELKEYVPGDIDFVSRIIKNLGKAVKVNINTDKTGQFLESVNIEWKRNCVMRTCWVEIGFNPGSLSGRTATFKVSGLFGMGTDEIDEKIIKHIFRLSFKDVVLESPHKGENKT